MNYYTQLLSRLTPIIVLTLFAYISACSVNETNTKNRSIGPTGEILVVMDGKFQNTQVQNIIQSFGNTEFPNIPQSEATFNITFIQPKAFKGHFKAYRNIILVEQKIMSTNLIEFKNDVWASHQQIVEINISNADSFAEIFEPRQKEILNFIYQGDIKALEYANRKNADKGLQYLIKKKYSLQLTVPKGFRLAKDTGDFCWLRLDRLETTMHLVIQSYNMDSLSAIENEKFIQLLDSVGEAYIPGPVELSFKQIEKEVPIQFSTLSVNTQEVLELRGLWKVDGFFMGGPFVSYFIQDKANNRLLMIDGFVHAPQKQNKAYYVRQIEAILNSVKIQ